MAFYPSLCHLFLKIFTFGIFNLLEICVPFESSWIPIKTKSYVLVINFNKQKTFHTTRTKSIFPSFRPPCLPSKLFVMKAFIPLSYTQSYHDVYFNSYQTSFPNDTEGELIRSQYFVPHDTGMWPSLKKKHHCIITQI